MSYDLPAIIRDIPDWETLTAAECREYLGEMTTVMVHRTWTASDLASVFGVGPYNDFRKATQAGFPAMSDLLVSGIDLGDDSEEGIRVGLGRVKAALMATGLSTLAALVDDVLAMGQDTRTRWQRAGQSGDLPSVEEFATAKEAAITPIEYTSRGCQFSLMLAGNRTIVSCRVIAQTESGQQGDTLSSIVSTNVDYDTLPSDIVAAITSIRRYMESL